MSYLFREDGYKFGNISSMTVSTVVTSFPANGVFHLHNAGTGTIYMGQATTIGASTGTWNLGAGEKEGPYSLTTGTYFIASAAQTLKFFEYIYGG
jgi:hypothetical protein